MTNRSADASIKGYNYQFIHSIIDILEQDDNHSITIEGIEDLDITNNDEIKLHQYKYHEFQSYRRSLVSKPLALMLNHFIKNRSDITKYKLLIYLNDDLPDLTLEELGSILNLKTAKDNIEEDLLSNLNYEELVSDFFEKVSWIKALKYEEIEKKIIAIMMNIFNVSHDEAMVVFLPNAIKMVNNLGMNKSIESRKITPIIFKKELKNRKDISDLAYVHRFHGEKKAELCMLKKLKTLNINKNSADKIVYISNYKRENLVDLLLNIIKRHFYKANKSDYRPLTIITDDSVELKKMLFYNIKKNNETILMNDGYEDYCFNSDIFNCKPITTASPLRGKVNEVNFNFKLISIGNFIEYKDKLEFCNPVLYCIESSCSEIIASFQNVILLNSFSNDGIINIIGG